MTRSATHKTRDDINLLDGNFYSGDPHEAWTWMRENAPVYYDEVSDVWGLTSYEDVLAASKDSARFSNAQGIRPHMDFAIDMMIDKDDPEHRQRRGLVNKGFTPARVRDKQPHIQTICDEIIDQICEKGSCDFVWDVAAPLPLLLIGDLLGFERDQSESLMEWSDNMLRSLSSTADPDALERSAVAAIEFREYQLGVIADRRSKPPAEDLVSILTHAEIDGERLGEEALVMESLLILIGGDETTRHVISGGMLAMLENPDQLERVRSGEVPLEMAVEEMLRWVTPIKNMNRTATTEIEIGGQTIAEGDQVLLLYPSANRDAKHFDDPFRFDVGRDPNNHIAFGFGSHFCLGNAVARLELMTMFQTLERRLPDSRLIDNAELPRRPANFVVGLEAMPVEFTATEKVG
jgi:cytochrome P450 family 142 subfamily A polypeptide 1